MVKNRKGGSQRLIYSSEGQTFEYYNSVGLLSTIQRQIMEFICFAKAFILNDYTIIMLHNLQCVVHVALGFSCVIS